MFIIVSDGDDFMEILKAVVPLQSATKAIYYYSIGLPSLAARLTTSLTISNTSPDHRDLARAVGLLLKKANGMRDTASSSSPALQAGNRTQKPYSDVLAAVESGDVSSGVVKAIVALFAKNGIK